MQSLIDLRRYLHQFPELSSREANTSEIIAERLISLNPTSITRNIGGYGIVVNFESGHPGPHIGLRCELDALPIDEENDLPYRSLNPGISHKCGHDGHMAILVGVGEWLSKNHLPKGKVSLIFQPAEETGTGAQNMINDDRWPIDLDHIIALHNLPGYPLHHILTYKGQLTPTVLSLGIHLQGTTSHASQPHLGINPSIAISEIVSSIMNLNITNREDESYRIITPVHTRIGTKDYGISPGTGETHFTLRTHSQKQMEDLTNQIARQVSAISRSHRLSFHITESDYFPSVNNDPDCIRIIKEVCLQNHIKVCDLDEPLPFGEDFGFFTKYIKGAMVGLGSGIDSNPLHNPAYDFPDEIIDTGVKLFTNIIGKIISS